MLSLQRQIWKNIYVYNNKSIYKILCISAQYKLRYTYNVHSEKHEIQWVIKKIKHSLPCQVYKAKFGITYTCITIKAYIKFGAYLHNTN